MAFLLLGACFAVAGLTFQRIYGWLSTISLAGAAIITVWPWLTSGVGTLILVLVATLSIEHTRRSVAAKQAGSSRGVA